MTDSVTGPGTPRDPHRSRSARDPGYRRAPDDMRGRRDDPDDIRGRRDSRDPRARREPSTDGRGHRRPEDTPARRRPAGHRSQKSARPTGHVVVALLSTLILLVTGIAWQSIDSLRSNLATVSNLGLGGGTDGAIDILLVGTDSRTDAHGNELTQAELDSLRAGEEVANNTDTILLVRVPNDGSSATAISIPRDAYVRVPGIGDSKINAAYGATKEEKRIELVESGVPDAQADAESTEAGRQALVESVADLTGVTVDHYAEVGLLGFVLLTDAVGGVDVCLNNPVDEPLSGARFAAGEQTLSGADALSFVRQRHDLPRGDLDRIVRQQVFMASLVREVLSARTLSNPSTLSQLGAAVQRSVVLDSDWDILQFATNLQDVAGGAVTFETIPVADINGVTDYGESIVAVDPVAVQDWVRGLSGDAATEDDATPTDDAPDIDPSSVTVDVANDSGIDGLAAQVASDLSNEGFGTGDVGNNEDAPVTTTTVFAASVDSDAATVVAARVGAAAVETDATLPRDTVRVVVAADYRAPTVDPGATGAALAGVTSAGDLPIPAPPAQNPIDAGNVGPQCVN